MKRSCLLIAAVALAGCAQYATVSEIRPRFHPTHNSVGAAVAVQQEIATALARERSDPMSALGTLLTAAEAASQTLARDPKDEGAREAYNFAVARIFSAMRVAKRDPWAQPLRVPAAGGDYTLHYVRDPKPARYAGLYDYTPADQFDIKGIYVTERTEKPGLLTTQWRASGGSRGCSDGQPQNAPHFGNGLRILMGAVVRGDDKFRLCAVEMAAPVRHDAIGTDGRRVVFIPALSAVADDRMNARCDRHGVDRLHNTIVWGNRVDAVWNSRETKRA
jgi:hypothetical protein